MGGKVAVRGKAHWAQAFIKQATVLDEHGWEAWAGPDLAPQEREGIRFALTTAELEPKVRARLVARLLEG